MSEKLNLEGEQIGALLRATEREIVPGNGHAEKPKHSEADRAKQTEKARASVEHAAARHKTNPVEHLQAAEKASEPAQHTYINRELKSITLRRELQQIRRKLPAPQRALSKLIHQPAVRVVSEGVGKTVSRPSGLLGGGLVAFIGSSGYLYLAKHMGYTYNYFVFLVLFAGGFALGLILELTVYSLTRRKSD
jgi:hypothetical protein